MNIEKKPKPVLKHWKELHCYSSGSVSLSDGGYFGISCRVYKDRIEFCTHTGAGHGEPSWSDEGRSYEEWRKLLDEAEEVRKHYFC